MHDMTIRYGTQTTSFYVEEVSNGFLITNYHEFGQSKIVCHDAYEVFAQVCKLLWGENEKVEGLISDLELLDVGSKS